MKYEMIKKKNVHGKENTQLYYFFGEKTQLKQNFLFLSPPLIFDGYSTKAIENYEQCGY